MYMLTVSYIVPMMVSPSANCVLKLSKMSISPDPGQAPYLQADVQQLYAKAYCECLCCSIGATANTQQVQLLSLLLLQLLLQLPLKNCSALCRYYCSLHNHSCLQHKPSLMQLLLLAALFLHHKHAMLSGRQ
jgi:hypothetical protein